MRRARFSDWELLTMIKALGGETCTELADKYGVTRQAMHLRLTRLVGLGLLTKEDGSGRRAGKYIVVKDKPWRRSIT